MVRWQSVEKTWTVSTCVLHAIYSLYNELTLPSTVAWSIRKWLPIVCLYASNLRALAIAIARAVTCWQPLSMQPFFLLWKQSLYLKPNGDYLKNACLFLSLTMANFEILLGSNMHQSSFLSSLITGHLERGPSHKCKYTQPPLAVFTQQFTRGGDWIRSKGGGELVPWLPAPPNPPLQKRGNKNVPTGMKKQFHGVAE